MHAYSEVKVGNHSVFERITLDGDGKVALRRQVDIPLLQAEKDGFTYLLLYDEDMCVIKDAFVYLNHTIASSPLTTRLKKAHALRFLYCFLSLSSTKITEIEDRELAEYVMFLRGIGTVAGFGLQTQRANRTVNGHLAAVRDYFKKCGIDCPALFRSKTAVIELNAVDYPYLTQRTSYDSNVKASPWCDREVPKYISPEEMGKLYRLAIDNKDDTAQLLMHLTYIFGLRLGECLGLTTEDVTEMRISGELTPVLILRNRISDQSFQYAKGLMHVKEAKQYATPDYRSSCWVIPITYETYEMVLNYIERHHADAIAKYPDNYAATIADSVTDNGPEENHYIFLNRYGRVLSAQTWGNTLKRYFQDVGIPLDYEARRNNLTHRFRHGFAMFHAWFREHPVGVLELQKMMRHSSISSTMVYFNPTIEDQIRVKTGFQEELYTLI